MTARTQTRMSVPLPPRGIGILGGIGILACALAPLFGQSALHLRRYPSPVDLAVSPDGRRLYVVCEGTDELLVADAVQQSILARVPVGRVPRGLALDSRGERIYVTNSWADTVSEIDARSLRVTRTFTAGFEPSGVTLDARGQALYVANRISNDISVIDLASGRESKRLAGGRGTSFLAPAGSRVFATHIYPNIGK
jgi:YVTN family beta-propeller protein